MKKNLLIICLLAAFILGSFGFTFAALVPQRDNVQFSETVLYGNPEAAEGLTLRYQNHYDYHLFWDTTWTIGTPADTAVTDYRFSARRDRDSDIPEHAIQLETNGFATHTSGDEVTGLQNAFNELAETAKPDKENIRSIYLADYYQYYPLEVTMNLPGMEEIHWDESYYALAEQEKVKGDRSKDYIRIPFQEFFKIPVFPQDMVEIQVYVNGDGNVTSTSTGHGSDTFSLIETESVLAENSCYFTFTTRTWNGQYLDTSLIPGGFGIYALPYSADSIQPENLSMVYPLDPKAQVIRMELNHDESSMFLFTSEPDGYYFTEIEMDSMRTLQRLCINDPYLIYDDMMHVTDDYFAFYGVDNNDVRGFRIFSRGADGKFQFDFLIPSPTDKEREFFNFYSEATFAYDGKRAALTGTAVSTSIWSSAFTVAVYDETGMLYCGEYNTGQNCRSSSYGNYDCVPASNQLAELSWS